MANLFQKAKSKGTTPKAKAAKEQIIINEKSFHDSLTKMVNLKEKMATMASEVKAIDAELRETGIEQFAKLYDTTGKYPGSFEIVAKAPKKSDASYLFLPTDRYIKIDEERAEELKKEYGEKIVTTETKFVMDSALVEKYGEKLSKAIEGIKGISQDEKDRLISAVTSFTVTKGTIKDLKDYSSQTAEILEEIRPVYQIKNVKIDE